MSVTLDDDHDEILGLLPDGAPDPAWAEALGLVPASAARRSLAFVIDSVLVLIVTLPLSLGAVPLLTGILIEEAAPSVDLIVQNPAFGSMVVLYAIGQGLLSILVLIQLLLHGFRGVTVGKTMVGIRSVDVVRFARPGFWRVVLRAGVFWVALTIVPVIGGVPFLLSPLWDRQGRGRGWLDRIGKTWLVDIRDGLDPFDQKAMRHAIKRALAPTAGPVYTLPSLATGSAGAVPSFVPAGRSSSGVIGIAPTDAAGARPWIPPVMGSAERGPTPGRTVDGDSAASVKAPIVELAFDDGQLVSLSGVGLIGRRPQGRPDELVDLLIPLDDDSRQISKTHLQVGVDVSGVWLLDRGSVNGTMVSPPRAERYGLVPWQRETVVPGTAVEVGGRAFTIAPDAKDG